MELVLGPKDEPYEIWPENHAAWQAFMRIQTQWAAGGMGGISGFDYVRVRAGLEMAGVAVTPELFEQLRHIEAGALEEFAKRNKPKK